MLEPFEEEDVMFGFNSELFNSVKKGKTLVEFRYIFHTHIHIHRHIRPLMFNPYLYFMLQFSKYCKEISCGTLAVNYHR